MLMSSLSVENVLVDYEFDLPFFIIFYLVSFLTY